ncbi:MAG TPA: MEDS domain-containing protein [Polyangia bacterium]|jgi:PAS domain S-box-containing protein|nr:MEDS domain-containing protein [Polyangia bacterium]
MAAVTSLAQNLFLVPEVHNHIVQFYNDDERLSKVVGDFLAAGLEAGEPVVVIATPDHRDAFQEQLRVRGFDVEGAAATGQLMMLDARATLATFMVGGQPDWDAFRRHVGGTLEKVSAANQGRRIRAYGEMVDLLWRDGQRSAAIHLEQLWNDLRRTHSFSLLCAYVMGNFYRDTDREQFELICRTHSHVVPAESYVDAADPADRLRQITLLQQRALALETELQERLLREQALRVALEERRQAQEALQRSQQELQDFVENAAEGLHQVDGSGIVQWANQAELDLLGYRRDEYVGHHISEFHADQDVINDILARLSRNESLHGYEARLKAKDGSIRHVLINSNVFHRDGEFIHTRCFTRDITDRKRAEDEARLRYEFEQQLLGIVSHDLRNPINAIMMSASLARARTTDDRLVKTLTRITSSAERAARIVADLLDLTQARLGGGLPIEREPTNIHDVAQAVVDEIGAAHPEREFAVRHEGDGEGHWDGDRLAQALSNLVSNAIDHGTPETPISVASRGQNGQVILSVHNQGMPIPERILCDIFAPFKRGVGRQRTSKSLGLGLFIVDRIVAAHGGQVVCRSTESEGTTFEMVLPRGPESS